MEKRKCPALVNGKECGLTLTLVERELETATAIYECPLGHRTHVLVGELERRKCPVLVNAKACGLTLTLVEREIETATAVYECPLGHRSYVPLEPEATDSS